MKKNKILSILLSIIMLLSTMFPTSAVFAVGEDIALVISSDKSTANVGDVVTFTVSLNAIQANTSINSAAVIVEFNQNDFELATGNYAADITINNTYIPFSFASTSSSPDSLITYKYLFVDMNADKTITNGTSIMTVKLKAKDSVGTKTITVKPEAEFLNMNFDIFTVAAGSAQCNITSPALIAKTEAIALFKTLRDAALTGVNALKAAGETAKTNATLIPAEPLKNDVTTKITAVDAVNKTDDQLNAMADATAINTAKTALQTALNELSSAITTLNNAQTVASTKATAIQQFKTIRDNASTGVDALKIAAAAAKLDATLVPAVPLKNAVDAKVTAVNFADKSDTQLEAMTAEAINTAKAVLQTALNELSSAITTLNSAQTAAYNAVLAKAEAITQFKIVRDEVSTGVTALKAVAETAKTNATLVADSDPVKVAVTTKITAVDAVNKTDDQLNAMTDAVAVNTAKTTLQAAMSELTNAITTLNSAQSAAVAAKNQAIEQFKSVRDNTVTGVDALIIVAETAKTNATLIVNNDPIKVAVDTKVAAVNTANKSDSELAALANATAVNTAKTTLQTALNELTSAITALNGAQATAAQNAATNKADAITQFKAVRENVTTGVNALKAAGETAKTNATLVPADPLKNAVDAKIAIVNTANKSDTELAAMADAAAVNTAKAALQTALNDLSSATTALNNAQTAAVAKTEAIELFKAVRDNTVTGVAVLKTSAAAAKLDAQLIAPTDALKVAIDAKVAAADAANKNNTELTAMNDAAAVNTAKAALQTALNELSSAITALNDAQAAAHAAALTKAEAITLYKAVRDNGTTGVVTMKATAVAAKTNATLILDTDSVKAAVDTKVAAVDAAAKTDDQLNALADATAVNAAKAILQTALNDLSSAITVLNAAQSAAVTANVTAITNYANSLTTTYTVYGDQILPFQIVQTPAAPAGITVTGQPTISTRPAAGAADTSVAATLIISKGAQQVTKNITAIVKPELNQLQRVVLAALAADTTARNNFTEQVLGNVNSIDTVITSDMIAVTRTLGITEDMMTNAEITNALKAYAPYSSVQKVVVMLAIKAGLPAEASINIAGIPNVVAKINGEIAGNPANNVGIRLFKKMVDTAYSINSAPIAKDKGSNGAQIDFEITAHEAIKATLSDLINSIDSIKITIASQPGATNLDKLFNYAENEVNALSTSEIAAFKTFLGSAYVRTYVQPVDPPVNPPAPPVTPPAPLPNTAGTLTTTPTANGGSLATLAVDPAAIEKLIAATTSADITIDLTAAKNATAVKVEIPDGAFDKIVAANKPLTLQSESTEIVLPIEVLKQIAAVSANGTVNINVSIVTDIPAMPTSNAKAVAQVIDFTISAGSANVTNFNKPVSVSIKVDGTKIGDYRKVSAYYFNETTKVWEAIGGYMNKTTGELTFITNHFSKYTAIENNKTFADVSTPWAKDNIEVLASRNIMNGVGGAQFAPKYNITRAEVAAMIARALGLETKAVTGKFADVSASKWYAAEVEAAANAGIIDGVSNGKFAPELQITREQIATMIFRALEYKQGKTELVPNMNFTDASSISAYAKNAVAVAAHKGIVLGSDNKFDPKDKATREQVAVMIYRMLVALGQM